MIKQDAQLKIPSIAQLEQELLADSTSSDMELPADTTQDAARTLTAAAVRHDVSTFARCLINVYGGWPFYDVFEKRKILTRLKKIYDTAEGITAMDLFTELGNIIADMPDEHIILQFGKKRAKTKLGHKKVNVGKNKAGDLPLRMEPQGKTLLIAVGSVATNLIERYFQPSQTKAEAMINDSDALIVDLRGNGGGDGRPLSWLAYRLYGAHVRVARHVYIRATPDAKIVHKNFVQYWQSIKYGEADFVEINSARHHNPDFEHDASGYHGPVYVLIDGDTCSAAEQFCLLMRHHPYVKFVGDNTRGCEVYGNTVAVYLPNSHIGFGVGSLYRELDLENFELNGYPPDIRVPDGRDAYDVAMQDLAATRMNATSKGYNK